MPSSSRPSPSSRTAPAHAPSGKFTANTAWLALAVTAFNVIRAAGAPTSARRQGHCVGR